MDDLKLLYRAYIADSLSTGRMENTKVHKYYLLSLFGFRLYWSNQAFDFCLDDMRLYVNVSCFVMFYTCIACCIGAIEEYIWFG